MRKRGFRGTVLFVWAAGMLLAASAAASEKFTVLQDKPMDGARRPAAGKALVYFVRTQLMGGAVKVKLYADGRFLGIIMSRNYVAYECDPGKHEFIAAAENAGFLRADLKPDAIYVVQVAIHMGAFKARTHFETARTGSEAMDEFLKVQPSLRAIETTEEGRAWAAEKDEEFQRTIARFREKGEEFEDLKLEDGFAAPPWLK